MKKLLLLHNPACSKSRQALALAEEHLSAEELQVVEYLRSPLDRTALVALSGQLGLSARHFIRSTEAEFSARELAERLEDDDALFKAIAECPKLMQRPIAVRNGRAVICRPPERLLELLQH